MGTNLGDRLENLRQAYQLIKKIPTLTVLQVSPIYISDALLPEHAPKAWDRPHLNLALRCETTLTPLELLEQTKSIEKKLQSADKEHWGPRVIDIDLLAWDDLTVYNERLHIPHEHLHERPFALWPLTDVAPRWVFPHGPCKGKTATEVASQWCSKFTGHAPLHAKQIYQRIDSTQWVGIVNLTSDSFSADGLLHQEDNAWRHAQHLVESGAEILDIGAEATGPQAISLDPKEEWQRLEPLLTKIIAEKSNFIIPPKVSVDTRHVDVAKKALELGVDWINDVSGLEDPAMCELIQSHPCDTVFMHHLGVPTNKNRCLPLNEDPVRLVYEWAERRLAEFDTKGIPLSRLIFDPGIGYGKTPEQSLEIIQHIAKFQPLGIRLFVGHSRKSFLSLFTTRPPAERDMETMLVSLQLAKSVDYLRIHHVELHARALRLINQLSSPSV